MLTVAFYSFAFGIQYKAAAVPGLHSSLGTIAVALVVVVTLMFFRGRVEFESVYSAWLPCMATVFILLPTSGAFDEA